MGQTLSPTLPALCLAEGNPKAMELVLCYVIPGDKGAPAGASLCSDNSHLLELPREAIGSQL